MSYFRCTVIHVKHSVSSCVARHRKGEDPSCRRCPVGKAHAKGDLPEHWPTGAPIERDVVVVPVCRIPSRRRRRVPAA